MKFSLKLLLWTMIVMAVTLGTGGFFYVNYVFRTALERERGQAMDENSILKFAFETAALNVPAKYDVLPDRTVEQIASNLENSGQNAGRMLRFSDEEVQTLYASDGFAADKALLSVAGTQTRAYRIIKQELQYYVQTCSVVHVLDRVLYLETMRDVTEVYKERSTGFTVYRRMMILMLLAGAVILHFMASWLTKPIRLLTEATQKMASGDYAYRAEQVSTDELGDLTQAFNRMAEALEENICRLQEEIGAREEFVGAFAHELKTPLTAMIGYADMLRSRKLDEEKSFLSASYIYTEGKRLEAMSIRLLEIIVAKRGEVRLRTVPAERLATALRQTFLLNEEWHFVYSFEQATVSVEADLIKTVLVNLIDNACRASERGSVIDVSGSLSAGGYRFAVRDHGVGIPEEEQDKITKAFYMVDKSRSRSHNGAGLGLALCAEILKLHGSRLEIESTPGEGSCIGFVVPAAESEPEKKIQDRGNSEQEAEPGREPEERHRGSGEEAEPGVWDTGRAAEEPCAGREAGGRGKEGDG